MVCLTSAHCGPSGFTAIADDGQRFRGSYLKPVPIVDDGCPVEPDAASTLDAAQPKSSDAVIRLRPTSRLARIGDSRFDPAAMSDTERAALLDSEVQNDSQPVVVAMRRLSSWVDSLGRLHGAGFAIVDQIDAANRTIAIAEYVAYSRLPVSEPMVGPLPMVDSGNIVPMPASERDDSGTRYLAACGQYTHPAPMARQPLVSREVAAELLVESLAEFVADLAKVERLRILAACGS